MPIYMDKHFAEAATRQTLELAHQQDLLIQEQYQVKFLTYWFDEERSTAFCLVDSPDKDTICTVHQKAHGGVPHEIIEVDIETVRAFLGRIGDPVIDHIPQPVDSAFRVIMFTDLKNSTGMTSQFGDKHAIHLLHIHNAFIRNELQKFEGSEIKHTGDGFMLSFIDTEKALNCAIQIQKAFNIYNLDIKAEEQLHVRIGLSAGEPVEENNDLFGTTVQKAARICDFAQADHILVDSSIKDNCTIQLTEKKSTKLKGFPQKINLYEVPVNLAA